VFSARTSIGTGFVIHIAAINGQNHWVLNIGNGTALAVFDTNVLAAVDGSQTYVAVTFESTNGTTGTLSLWINPASDTDSNTPRRRRRTLPCKRLTSQSIRPSR
jgi:hypothetical protein